MSGKTSKASADVLADLQGLLSDLEAVYKDLHAHPELSMRKNGRLALQRTAFVTLAMK